MGNLLLVLNLAAIMAIAVWVGRKLAPELRFIYWPALVVKLAAGIFLGIIYQNYYTTGDTFGLFQLAQEKAKVFNTDEGVYLDFLLHNSNTEWKGAARSVFFVKIASVAAIITAGNYWISSLWFSLISFLGCLYLFVQVDRRFEMSRWAAAFAFLFFPSVVFWSSGIIKESIGLAALMFVSGVFLQVAMNRSPRLLEFLIAVGSIWILWNLKYYWIAVFLAVTVTTLLIQWGSRKVTISSSMKWPLWLVVFLTLSGAVSLIHPNFHLDRLLNVVVENNQAFTAASERGDLIHYHQLEPTFMSVTLNAPWALFSGLFRPFFWEARTSLQAIASLENSLILFLLLSALLSVRRLFTGEHSLISLSVVVYILLLCVFLSLSTPNLGTLSRYRVGFLPFLIFLISYKNPLVGMMLGLPGIRSLNKWFD